MSKFFKKLYRIFDEIIIVPISRIIYNIQKKNKKGSGTITTTRNRRRMYQKINFH